MADYPELANTLAALEGTKADPSDAEDAAKLAAVDRQTRTWLYDFLTTIIDPTTGKLLATVVDSETSIPEGGIRGSTANDGTQQEILNGSVSTPDLRDGAVSTTKLADEAVTGAKIADGAVDTDQLADDAVEAAKIADGAVVEAALGAGAVTSAKIGALAVTTAKIANAAVTVTQLADGAASGTKLPTGTAGQILLHNGTSFVATTVSGSLSLSSAGVATVAVSTSASWCRVSERVASGTSAGASAAASWTQKRGVATSWVIDEQTIAGTISLGAAGLINITSPGVYLITVSVPAYSAGCHKAKVTYTPVSGPVVDYVGSTECAGPGTQTSSRLQFLLTVTTASAGSPATLTVFHWTELAKATNGLGLASSAPTEVERYAMVEILKVSST